MSRRGARGDDGDFAQFVGVVEAKLREALVATYGLRDGREVTVDALSWAWEHWDQVRLMDHPVGYLYRVGQTAVRRFGTRPLPVDLLRVTVAHLPDVLEINASTVREHLGRAVARLRGELEIADVC